MLKFMLPLVGAFGLFVAPATAGDGRDWRDDGYHRYLRERERARDRIHRDAHRYPMTRWEHHRLHDWLDRERDRDRWEHRAYHRHERHHHHGHRHHGHGHHGHGHHGHRHYYYSPGYYYGR
jgi:hypothetical protein